MMLVPVLGSCLICAGMLCFARLATRYLKRPPFFLSALAVLSNLVSAMLLVGCLPLIYHLVEKVAEGDESGLRQRLLTVSILQGCSSAGLWSPSWVLVAMSLSIGTRWQEIALYGFLLAAVSILVASAYLFFLARPLWHAPLLANGQEEETGVPPNRALEFLFLLVVFLAVVLLGDTYTDLGVINVVPLAAVALTALGYTLTGNITTLPGRAWKFLQGQIPRQSGILSLLMSTGFLSAALFSTGLGLDLFNAFLGLLDQFSISILTGLPILICLLGYVGIDPVGSRPDPARTDGRDAGRSTNLHHFSRSDGRRFRFTILCSFRCLDHDHGRPGPERPNSRRYMLELALQPGISHSCHFDSQLLGPICLNREGVQDDPHSQDRPTDLKAVSCRRCPAGGNTVWRQRNRRHYFDRPTPLF